MTKIDAIAKDMQDAIGSELEEAIDRVKDAARESAAEAIETLLRAQPYRAYCHDCSNVLYAKGDLDSDGDLIVTVEPCAKCIDAAGEAARDEAREGMGG